MDSDNGDAPSGETNGDGGNDAGKSMSHFNKLDRLVQKLHDSADQSREPSPVPEDSKTLEKANSGDEDDKSEGTTPKVEENSVEESKKNKDGEEDDADTKEEPMETSKDATNDQEKEAGEEKECTTPARDQSVTPPPEGGSSSSRRKASRRKPTKTRKVVETESDVPMDVGGGDFFEDEVEAEYAATSPVPNGTGTDSNSKPNTPRPDTPGSAASPAPGPSGEPAESIDVDEHGNYILPEGTVLVEPEEVREEKNPVFKGPEFQAPKRTTQKAVAAAGGDLSNVRCTACSKQINPNNSGTAKRHPVLKVLICKKCYNWYASDEIEQDSNGIDEQCRWCGDGGNLICCDYCHNAFCKNCIKRNLGRAELSKILEADDDMKWHCYVCDPKPMANLIVHCTRIISAIDEYQRKEIEKKKLREVKTPVRPSPKSVVMTQGVHMPQQLTVGPGRTLTPTGRGVTSSRQPPQPVLLTQVPNLKGGGFQLVSVPVGKQGSHRGGMVQKSVVSPTVRQQLEQKRTQPQTGYRPADSQMWNIPITELNVTHVLERAMAITQSMNMLLGSLKDDLKPTQRSSDPNLVSRAKREVAVKLKRAMTAYRKSFNDIETYARNLIQVKAQQAKSMQSKMQSQQQQYMSRRSPQVVPRAVMQPTGRPVGRQKVVPRSPHPQAKPVAHKPKPPSGPPVVIELSDSSEEEILPKKSRKFSSERNPQNVESKSTNNKKESTEEEENDKDNAATSKENEKGEPSKRRKSTSSEGGNSDDSAEGQKKSFRLRVSLGGPGFSVKSSKKRRHSKDSQKSDDSLSDWGEREENGKEKVKKDIDGETVNGKTDSKKDAEEKKQKKTESEDEEDDREEEGMKDVKGKDEKDPQDDDDDSKDGSQDGGNQDREEESDEKKDEEESKEPDEEEGGAEEGEENSGEKNESMEVDKEGEDSTEDKDNDDTPSKSDKSSSGSPIIEPPQLDGAHDHDLPGGREQAVEHPLKGSKGAVSQDRSGADDEDDDDDDELFGHLNYEPLFEFPTIVSAEDQAEGSADLESVEQEEEDIGELEAISDSDQEETPKSTRRAAKGKSSDRLHKKQSPSSSKVSKSRKEESTSEEEIVAESKDRRTRKGKTVSSKTSPKSKSKTSRSPAPAKVDSDSEDESEESVKKEKRGRSPAAFQKRSRADIEAQRMLHKELLDEESGEESEDDSEDVEEDSSEGEEEDQAKQNSSGESSSDYNPKEDVIWDRRDRTKDRQKKMKEKFKKLRAERLKKQKKKREEDEKKAKLKAKEKKKQKSKKTEVSSDEDSDEDESPKKKNADRKSKAKNKDPKAKSTKKVKAETDSSEEAKVKEEGSKTKKEKKKKKEEKKKKTPAKSEDSSAEDFEDEKKPKDSSSKKKKDSKSPRKQKSTKSKKPDSDSDSDSESSGAELDKEIKRLGKLPKLSVKLKRLKDDDGDEKSSKNQDGCKESKTADKKAKGKRLTAKDKREEMIEELSSASEADQDGGDDDDEEENAEQEEAAEAVAMETEVAEDNEDARARRALLFEDSDDEDADNNMSSDSDLEQMKKEKEAELANKKHKPKAPKADTGSDAVDVDSSDSEIGLSPKKVTFKQTKLLRTKLSDDDDFELDSDNSGKSKRKTKKTSKKSRDDDSEDDLDANNSSSDSAFETLNKKKKKKKGKNDSDFETDSEEEEKKAKKGKKGKKGKKRKRIKMASDSSEKEEDTDSDAPKRKKKKKKKGSDDSEDEDNLSGEDMTPGKKRKHIRKILKDKKISSGAKEAAKAEEERRKRVTQKQKLYNEVTVEDASSPTKCPITTKLVLEMNDDKKPVIEVKEDLIRKLKPHQVQAVKFLWDCCVEDLGRLKKEEGSGCILAHCMGLGKTLSVIAFVHTLMRKRNRRKTNIKTCMVVCPLNTVLNWQSEFDKWLDEDDMLDVYELSSIKNNESRADLLRLWQEGGGVMILGYDMYRNLSNCRTIRKKKLKQTMEETLVDPGPDMVVCDEGHILKNDATGLSKAMNRIRTRRRIVLTGTPLQNNLVEYHCMVDFVKPKLLGTRKEFLNRFVNPIINGQCLDSTSHDVRVMKRRAHILHETLAGCVQRKDYSALTKFLMPKHEYVLSIRLSKVQIELYEKYLERSQDSGQTHGKGGKLFNDYQSLMRIWTHPWVLKLSEIRQENKRQYDSESEDSFLDDGDSESDVKSTGSDSNQSVQALSDVDEWAPRKTRSARMAEKASSEPQPGPSNVRPARQRGSDSDTDSDFEEVVKGWKTSTRNGGDSTVSRRGRITEDANQQDDPVSREWWAQYVSEEDKYKMELSGKLVILAQILKMCDAIGDKVLVFSQSLLSLDLIEDFLELWDSQSRSEDAKDHENEEEMIGLRKSWVPGSDYYRMDGSTSAQTRKRQAENFNDEENDRARLFLISTRAGGLGINLVAANRVIIFDASWNPSHDIQSIFRVYRFGQIKPVYVYRFLAQGTMEEKIYERQVTKESLSGRVIDEHQIERHFTQADLSELYNFTPDRLDDPDREERPIPELPEDRMLAELLTSHKDVIVQYHKHNSLLVNQVDQELTEEERKTAWDEYEQEKKGLRPPPGGVLPGPRLNPQLMAFQNQSAAHMNAWNNQIASQYQNPLLYQQQQNYMTNIERITKAIYHANPGISESDLQERVHHYIKVQQQQQAKRLREEQERYRMIVQQQQQAQYQMMYRQAQQSQTAGRSLLSGMLQPSRSGAGAGPDIQEVDLTSQESAIQDMLRSASGGTSHEEAVQELLRAAHGKN